MGGLTEDSIKCTLYIDSVLSFQIMDEGMFCFVVIWYISKKFQLCLKFIIRVSAPKRYENQGSCQYAYNKVYVCIV